MQAQNAGGTWYWDDRGHYTPQDQTEWFPMMAAKQLYKYRIDQSYPAFSNCSTNSRIGTGDPATADPIGQINALVDWDEKTSVDSQLRWEVTLTTRGATTRDGVIGAPAALDVDVTPRRLQTFIVALNVSYRFEVRRSSDGTLLQSGVASPDPDAVLTLPQIHVVAGGVRLAVFPSNATAGVLPGAQAVRVPHLAMSRNPVSDKASLTIEWPGQG